MSCPSSLISGDTWSWSVIDTDRSPADGWTLEFRFSGATNFALTVTANVANDGWDVAYTAASSASVSPGRYEWFARCSKAGIVQTIARGEVQVAPNISATGIDSRSSARAALDAIQKRLTGVATDAVLKYEIAGRRLEHYSLTELLALESRLQQEVRAEDDCARAASGLGRRGRVAVRFMK